MGGGQALNVGLGNLRDIDEAASRITVQGARYPEEMEKKASR